VRCVLNPPGIESEYLRHLNACFEGWGDEATFEWCFERRGALPAADLMTLDEDGQVIAGSGVSYRRLRTAAGEAVGVGIMTGSWTVPAARGRGCFRRVIEESRTRAGEGGCALLCAFVTHVNASYRALMAAGAASIPTWYLHSDGGAPASPAEALQLVPHDEVPWAEIHGRAVGAADRTRFEYPDLESWMSQFVGRPHAVRALLAPPSGWALVEEAPRSDRVLLRLGSVGLGALLQRASGAGRQLFVFTADEAVAAEAAAVGLVGATGSVCILGTDEATANGGDVGKAVVATRWQIHGGDRM
jgi:hypothetical protein